MSDALSKSGIVDRTRRDASSNEIGYLPVVPGGRPAQDKVDGFDELGLLGLAQPLASVAFGPIAVGDQAVLVAAEIEQRLPVPSSCGSDA